jgi:hypothetical protein
MCINLLKLCILMRTLSRRELAGKPLSALAESEVDLTGPFAGL